jgi:hypothetical protein
VKYRIEPSEAKLIFTKPSCVICLRPDTLGGLGGRFSHRNQDPTQAMTTTTVKTAKPFFRGTGALR